MNENNIPMIATIATLVFMLAFVIIIEITGL